MSKFLFIVVVVTLLCGLCLLGAQKASAQAYPNVASLKAFSAEANYMSLAGYLRWQVFVERKEWISAEEATRIVKEQTGGM